jgi:hypothetical protein
MCRHEAEYDSSVIILGPSISTVAMENWGKNNASWAHGANHWLVKSAILYHTHKKKEKLLQHP